jgi:tRNA pseudouridine32 synthase/23S rRNA pseudouridine746 synthase
MTADRGPEETSSLVTWQDASLLVVNKPAGLPTLVDGYHPEAPYLAGLLKKAYGRVWTVHRLDRETSGVMVFARTAAAHRALNTQFEQRQAAKVYHALVAGDPGWTEQRVNLPLRPDGDRRHRTVIDRHGGKSAQTELRVLERFEKYALVEAMPLTGRAHQIRAHLAAVGYPVVADKLYGDGRPLVASDLQPLTEAAPELVLERLGLHARRLSFTHPESGERLEFQADYPADFARALQKLRAGGC